MSLVMLNQPLHQQKDLNKKMITKMKRKTSEEKMKTFRYFSIQTTLNLDQVQRKVQAQREVHTIKASKILAKFHFTSASQAQTRAITNTSPVLTKYHITNISKRLIKCIKIQQLTKRLKKQLNLTTSLGLILTRLLKHHKLQRFKKNRK